MLFFAWHAFSLTNDVWAFMRRLAHHFWILCVWIYLTWQCCLFLLEIQILSGTFGQKPYDFPENRSALAFQCRLQNVCNGRKWDIRSSSKFFLMFIKKPFNYLCALCYANDCWNCFLFYTITIDGWISNFRPRILRIHFVYVCESLSKHLWWTFACFACYIPFAFCTLYVFFSSAILYDFFSTWISHKIILKMMWIRQMAWKQT